MSLFDNFKRNKEFEKLQRSNFDKTELIEEIENDNMK